MVRTTNLKNFKGLRAVDSSGVAWICPCNNLVFCGFISLDKENNWALLFLNILNFLLERNNQQILIWKCKNGMTCVDVRRGHIYDTCLTSIPILLIIGNIKNERRNFVNKLLYLYLTMYTSILSCYRKQKKNVMKKRILTNLRNQMVSKYVFSITLKSIFVNHMVNKDYLSALCKWYWAGWNVKHQVTWIMSTV